MTDECISPLRQRMIEDMSLRHFGEKTQKDYIRAVKKRITLPPAVVRCLGLRDFLVGPIASGSGAFQYAGLFPKS